MIGNCQAEALRHVLDSVPDRPYRTVRVPPVHELGVADLPHLDALLRTTAVLLSQPIRTDYRNLPLGTAQLAARLPATSKTLRWPVIRYAGLYPFQVIVRRPADRSVVPPPVPYHDLRTVTAAMAGRAGADDWDVDVDASAFRAVASASIEMLSAREQRDTDVAVSDTLTSAGHAAAHTINHPGNAVFRVLARRILDQLGVHTAPEEPAVGDGDLLGSVYAPLEQRVLDALGIVGRARTQWWHHGDVLDPDSVHRIQMQWYDQNPDFLSLAVDRHRHVMELLGLPTEGRRR